MIVVDVATILWILGGIVLVVCACLGVSGSRAVEFVAETALELAPELVVPRLGLVQFLLVGLVWFVPSSRDSFTYSFLVARLVHHCDEVPLDRKREILARIRVRFRDIATQIVHVPGIDP